MEYYGKIYCNGQNCLQSVNMADSHNVCYQISAMTSGDTWRKTEVTVSDDVQNVNCKFWNESADILVEVGDTIAVTNLVVRIWNDITSLNSTELTAIEVCFTVSIYKPLTT